MQVTIGGNNESLPSSPKQTSPSHPSTTILDKFSSMMINSKNNHPSQNDGNSKIFDNHSNQQASTKLKNNHPLRKLTRARKFRLDRLQMAAPYARPSS